VVVALVTTKPSPGPPAENAEPGTVRIEDLEAGDCVNGIRGAQEFRRLPTVPCAQPHEAEVFAVFTLAGSAWPGEAAVRAQAENCVTRLPGYAPAAAVDDKLDVFSLHPTRESWGQGDRLVTCLAVDLARRTGSIRSR